MTTITKSTPDALEDRLRELEALLEGIRRGEVDSVVSACDPGQVLVLRDYEFEKQRERQFSELKAIIDTVPTALAIVRADGTIVLANRAFYRVGGDEEYATLWQWAAGTPSDPQLAETLADALRRCLDGPQHPSPLKATFRAPAQEHVHWAITFEQLPMEIDGRLAVVFCGADVTAEERLIGDLCDAKSRMEQFLAAAAHDLKAPLFTINHNVGFARRSLGEAITADADECLRHAESAAQGMGELLARLGEVSRAGHALEPRRLHDARSLVESALRQLEGVLAQRGAEVTIADGLPELYCQPNGIVQAFSNLISNAVKYTPRERTPRIEIGYAPRMDLGHVFFVRDNGAGIAQEHLLKVFEPFRRLCDDPAVTGQGLGLNIVDRAVGAHGGQVWAESTPGKGSTFYFSIPRRQGDNRDYHDYGDSNRELPAR